MSVDQKIELLRSVMIAVIDSMQQQLNGVPVSESISALNRASQALGASEKVITSPPNIQDAVAMADLKLLAGTTTYPRVQVMFDNDVDKRPIGVVPDVDSAREVAKPGNCTVQYVPISELNSVVRQLEYDVVRAKTTEFKCMQAESKLKKLREDFVEFSKKFIFNPNDVSALLRASIELIKE